MVQEGGLERKYWITPGESYCVEMLCSDPCIEIDLRQVRKCNWELEPFIFYIRRKVALLVGVRERFNQAPVANINANLVVEVLPPTRRPPVVKPEW